MDDVTLSAFSVDKLMEETRRLARAFKQNTEQVLPISNELGRYDAKRILNLLPTPAEEKGVDFIGQGDLAQQKIQVKSRVIFQTGKSGQRIGAINPDGLWDSLLLVLYDADYNPDEIYIAQKKDILELLNDKKPNKRGSISIAKFKMMGQCIWQSEIGMPRQEKD